MANYAIVNGELYHWGIKGQKWGVRRFQNKDGTLTPAGKKRLQKMDSKYEKRNPDKAELAKKKRADVIREKESNIESAKRSMQNAKMLRDTDIDKIDFDSEAKRAIKESFEFLDESYRMGYAGVNKAPTEQDAINDFFWSNGMDAPKGATYKDVANVIRADTIVLKNNKVYDKLIEDDQKYIDQGKSIIDAVSNMPLKEIYDNRNDIHYHYWKDRGYYD